MVKKINSIIGFQVNLANNQSIAYVIDLKNGSGSVFVNNGSNESYNYFKIEKIYSNYIHIY